MQSFPLGWIEGKGANCQSISAAQTRNRPVKNSPISDVPVMMTIENSHLNGPTDETNYERMRRRNPVD